MREIFKISFFIYKMGKRTVPSRFTGESKYLEYGLVNC